MSSKGGNRLKNKHRIVQMPETEAHAEVPLIVKCIKVKYDSIEDAKRAARKHNMRAYKCNLCGSFHVTKAEDGARGLHGHKLVR